MGGKSFELLCTEMYVIFECVFVYVQCSSEKLKSMANKGLTQLGRQWWRMVEPEAERRLEL